MNKFKKTFLPCFLVMLGLIVFICSSVANANSLESKAQTEHSPVLSENEILDRLVGYLNINRCFNEDFFDEDALIEAAQISLLDFATFDNEATYINAILVEEFIHEFYGIKVSTESFDNSGFDIPEGYILVAPRGYSTISHKAISIEFNAENNEYTVISCLTSYSHEYETETNLCESVFKVNSESDYGFNLTSCEILGN